MPIPIKIKIDAPSHIPKEVLEHIGAMIHDHLVEQGVLVEAKEPVQLELFQ